MVRIRGAASLALLGYCVATALSASWVSFSFTGLNGATLTFVTFLIAQVVYTARAGRNITEAVRLARTNAGEVALLNVLTLVSWLFMFMALQRIEASVESAVFQGAVAVVGFVLAAAFDGQRYRRSAVAGMSAATVLLGLLVLTRMVGDPDVLSFGDATTSGLVLALLAGVTGGLYIRRSAALHRRTGAGVVTVLCVRFVLLLVVTGVLGAGDLVVLTRSDPGAIVGLIVLSMTFVVLPTFLLQYAITHLPTVRVASATPFVPVIALGSEYVVRPWGSVVVPLIVILTSAALVFVNVRLSRDVAVPGHPQERRPVDAGNDR